MHNGTCVKEKLECVAGEWGEYDVTYPLPEDAKQNSNKYIVNRILPDFNIEEDSNEWEYYQNETPIYYYNGQILTDWEYYGTDKSCAWTCADGYHINDKNNPTECIKDNDITDGICGKVGMFDSRYDKKIVWDNACPGDGDHLISTSKNENGRVGEDGCGKQAYRWKCMNNDSGDDWECHNEKRMGGFNVTFEKATSFETSTYLRLGKVKIDRLFSHPAKFAFHVRITDNNGNKSEIVLSLAGDVQSETYTLRYNTLLGVNTYQYGTNGDNRTIDVGGLNSSVAKIEYLGIQDQSDAIGYSKGIDAISFIKDSIGNSNCPGFDNTIYPYY